MKRRVVITGIGTINPIGHNLKETWENAKKGVCGIDFTKQFDTTGFKVKVSGEVKDYDPEQYLDKKEARKMDRYTQFAVIAAKEAFEDSGIDVSKEADPFRLGTIISSGIGGFQTIEEEHNRGIARGFEKISPFFIPMAISNMAAGEVAIRTGFKGECMSIVTACASSTNALGEAFHAIRDGYQDVVIAGGAEGSICDLAQGGFTVMKALYSGDDPNRASIPFDAERSGFVMAEGGAVLILEELEHAKARGAKIYAEFAGYGATCDAYHITAPDPEGTGAARAMLNAVADAGLTPEDIGYINAHGTSTHLNDAGETKAIHVAFGDHAEKLLVSSTKSMTGHLMGAGGALEAIFLTKAVEEGFVPATINYQVADPECDLDYVPNTGREVPDLKAGLSNSLGFGGHNATIAIKKYTE